MNTPTPPPGYKLVKGIDIKDHLPIKGLIVWLKNSEQWECSMYATNPLMREPDFTMFYAIPSEPESITDYGEANESFTRIAKLWSAYTGANISPWDVAQMMILLKVSRAKTSRKHDTLVDIVGYAECAPQLTTTCHAVA